MLGPGPEPRFDRPVSTLFTFAKVTSSSVRLKVLTSVNMGQLSKRSQPASTFAYDGMFGSVDRHR